MHMMCFLSIHGIVNTWQNIRIQKVLTILSLAVGLLTGASDEFNVVDLEVVLGLGISVRFDFETRGEIDVQGIVKGFQLFESFDQGCAQSGRSNEFVDPLTEVYRSTFNLEVVCGFGIQFIAAEVEKLDLR